MDFADIVEKQLSQWITSGENLATSTLTLLELLVVPMRQENKHLVQKYRALLQDILSEPLIPLTEAVSEIAAEIRGVNGFKTPDSIQLATALYSGADIFYTNDKRLSKLYVSTLAYGTTICNNTCIWYKELFG